MSRNTVILRWLLLAGALYFLAVASVHMLGIKIPVLYVYYSAPSYAYQDRIIAFLAFGWSLFISVASRDPMKNRNAVKAILVAGLGAIFGLNVINNTTDFQALSAAVDPSVFGKEVLLLTVYEAALIIFYFLSRRDI
jgi:hypothetical protein